MSSGKAKVIHEVLGAPLVSYAIRRATARVADPTGYGRILRDGAGGIRGIVEHKDASDAERRIDEINAGVYAAPADFLREATARLQPQNAQGEYYLTDIVAQAAATIGA